MPITTVNIKKVLSFNAQTPFEEKHVKMAMRAIKDYGMRGVVTIDANGKVTSGWGMARLIAAKRLGDKQALAVFVKVCPHCGDAKPVTLSKEDSHEN